MNKVILVGRLTRDPELRTTSNNIPVCTFTVAVDRRYKNQAGEREADFITTVAWRQQAEFVTKYFFKGSRIGLVGSIQTRSWDDQEGKRRYATEVVADEIYFVDSKRESQQQQTRTPVDMGGQSEPLQDLTAPAAGFLPTDDDSTELPFDF